MWRNEAPMNGLLTTRDVQRRISVDKSTIYRMAEAGTIPAVKIGRQWRFPADALDAWLQERSRGSRAAPTPVSPPPPTAMLSPVALQAIGDLAGDLLGVMVLVTALDGTPLTTVSNPCPFFDYLQALPGVVDRCTGEWRMLGDEFDLVPSFRPSPFGFLCARTFVRVDDRLEAMVIAGGIAPDRWPPDTAAAERMAVDLGVSVDELTEHVDGVFHLDPDARQHVLRALPRLGALVSLLIHERSTS